MLRRECHGETEQLKINQNMVRSMYKISTVRDDGKTTLRNKLSNKEASEIHHNCRGISKRSMGTCRAVRPTRGRGKPSTH